MSLAVKNKLFLSDSQCCEVSKRRRLDSNKSDFISRQVESSSVTCKINSSRPGYTHHFLNRKADEQSQLTFSASILPGEGQNNILNFQYFLNPQAMLREPNSNECQRSLPLEEVSHSPSSCNPKNNSPVENALVWQHSLSISNNEITPEFIELLKTQFGNDLGSETPKFLGCGSYFKAYKITLNNKPYVVKVFHSKRFIKEQMTDHVVQEIKYYFRILKAGIPTVGYKEWDHLINASEEEIVNFVNSKFPGFYLAPYIPPFDSNDVYENFLELGLSYDQLGEDHPYRQIKEMFLKFYKEDIIPDATAGNMGIQDGGKVVLFDLFNEKLELEEPSYTYATPLMTRLDDAASDFVPDSEEDPQSTDLYKFLMPARLKEYWELQR